MLEFLRLGRLRTIWFVPPGHGYYPGHGSGLDRGEMASHRPNAVPPANRPDPRLAVAPGMATGAHLPCAGRHRSLDRAAAVGRLGRWKKHAPFGLAVPSGAFCFHGNAVCLLDSPLDHGKPRPIPLGDGHNLSAGRWTRLVFLSGNAHGNRFLRAGAAGSGMPF